ncbi:putative defense protein 3 [Eurytemora carolleeae]|uniref:putative defense protein 3 n=1 Tax=Eurytemora carolleeae TaxID=1294199 RepID=UPI000C77FD83|nr:putative defense protein 3 [Eurytemora carolleeae]|eukprot:XP_023332893.1 putative defense protein 3 [Eurytemora affinis]
MKLIYSKISLLFFIAEVYGYSTGAPEPGCITLEPGHGNPPRDNQENPYHLQVKELGTRLEIILKGSGWLIVETFRGFIIQVRQNSDDAIIGSFDINSSSSAQYGACSLPQNTVTHLSSDDKTSVSVIWNSPRNFHGQVYVTASVVQDYNNYWVDFRSDIIDIKKTTEPEPEPEPEQETEPEPEPETDERAKLESKIKPKHVIYDGCFETKGCFGYPALCEVTEDCQVVASWRQVTTTTTTTTNSLKKCVVRDF